MRPKLIDLHTHSTVSDGSDSPTELVRKAAEANLMALALTDHDTIAGLEEAEEAGHHYNIEIIRGCEISASSPYGEVHFLGLWVPKKCNELETFLARLRDIRNIRNNQILEKLATIGRPLSLETVFAESGGESIGRPHIAKAMVRQGYIEHMDDAFRLYIGKDKPAFVPKVDLRPEDAVQMLHNMGATVAFAHPMLLRCPKGWQAELVARLRPYGLDAIEAYHSEHSAVDERYCVDIAARHQLLLTGGSDYHGKSKSRIRLGVGKGGLRVSVAILEKLKAQRREKGLLC